MSVISTKMMRSNSKDIGASDVIHQNLLLFLLFLAFTYILQGSRIQGLLDGRLNLFTDLFHNAVAQLGLMPAVRLYPSRHATDRSDRAFDCLQHISHTDLRRGFGENVASLRTPDTVHKAGLFYYAQDLLQETKRDPLVFGNRAGLKWTAAVVQGQLKQSQDRIFSFSRKSHVIPTIPIGFMINTTLSSYKLSRTILCLLFYL